MKAYVTFRKSVFFFLLITMVYVFVGERYHPLAEELALGDVNGDHDITSIDAAMTLQMIGGTIITSPEQRLAADVDQDAEVSLTDAEIILYWASQGTGPLPPGDPIDLPILESASEVIGSEGGDVSLSSGVTVSMPAGQLAQEETITLSKCDITGLDTIGTMTCYQISPDISHCPDATITIPYSDLVETDKASDDITGVGITIYNHWKRGYEMTSVEYTPGEHSFTVNLNQVREDTQKGTKWYSTDMPQTFPRFQSGGNTSSVHVIPVKRTSIDTTSTENKVLLEVPYYDQATYGYCWAGVTCMAMKYYHHDIKLKPWNLAKDLQRSPKAGLNLFWEWLGITRAFSNYIFGKTGKYPQIQPWVDDGSLRDYLKKQIMDKKQPVFLGMPYPRMHVVLAVGYEVDSYGSHIIYYHDPANILEDGIFPCNMYFSQNWDILKRELFWVKGTGLCTTAIIPSDSAPAKKPITVSTLFDDDHREVLAFVSPLESNMKDVDSLDRISFHWYDEGRKGYGFISHNGKGMMVDAIPNYYKMDLRVQLANAYLEKNTQVVVKWELVASGHSGEKIVDIPKKTIQLITFTDLDLKTLNGTWALNVEVLDSNSRITYDEFSIDIDFDEGIRLRGSVINENSKEVVKLTWNEYPYSGDFDYYYVYRRTGPDSDFMLVGPSVARDRTKEKYELIVKEYTKNSEYAVSAIKISKNNKALQLISSNVVTPTDCGVVDFPDECMEDLIRRVINKPTGDILGSDLETVTTLSSFGYFVCAITDMKGIECCVNLRELDLYLNEIRNLSPLEGLQDLTSLKLSLNEIEDISPLSGLANLTMLDLSYNKISRIASLAALGKLINLDLSSNPLENITALSGVNSLAVLYLNWCGLECDDIKSLVDNAGLGSGDYIELMNNSIGSDCEYVQQLRDRGVTVLTDLFY